MQYMHDSKVRPETIKEMGKVEPEIVYIKGDGSLMRPTELEDFMALLVEQIKEQKEII